MNSYGYERQPAPQGWRRYGWVVILIVGVGLGALLVGPVAGELGVIGGRGDRDGLAARSGQHSQATTPNAPQQDQASGPDTTQQQTGSRQAAPRSGTAQQPRGDEQRGGRHGGFFPFALFELLVPLLLIGAGAWLIWGRRREPWKRGFAKPADPAGPPEPMPPATGETRRL